MRLMYILDLGDKSNAFKLSCIYCNCNCLVDKNIAKRQTAAEYLQELEKIGILKSQKVGVENLFLNVKLFEILKS